MFLSCDFSSWHEITIPVGICVSLTAESVVFTHCPPFPDARNTSKRQSFISISTSTSSASGIIATVAVDVWIRPPDSVTGILCTLWTPLSYFNFEYAPWPLIINTTSLKPPNPFSLTEIISVFQCCVSAYIQYILYNSAANKAASSPPAPPRISTTTFLSSFSSFGRSKIFNFSSNSVICSFASFISSLASSLISSSDSSSKIMRLSSTVCLASL